MALKEIFVFVACFAMLCGFGDSVEIQCEYGTDSYFAVRFVYECRLRNTLNIKSRESAVINSVNGSHLSGKSNADVTGFWSSDSSYVIEYFPRNLDNIFTNLKMIEIQYGRLKEIQQSDLRPFTKLVVLSLYDNNIEFLEDGLFAYNPELKFVDFSANKIIHIGSQVFDNLNTLTSLWLHENKCIDMDGNNIQTSVKEVISQAKSRCLDYPEIDKDLQKLENSLLYVSSESLPIFDQNLQKLQSRFQNSTISQYLPLKERFQAITSWKSKNIWTVKDKMSSIETALASCKSELNQIKIINTTGKEANNTNDEKTFTGQNVSKYIIIVISSIWGLINIVLIIIFNQFAM
ncbi:unnamed protein product [Chironomus riparius]|uniref:Uncharacterized protein n=1 Tax=Chironomus riparius TaxID=315576 RepID=A0A9N9S4R5_9DIPT|nr:unnamed protein product [Chironomus riparius]